MLRARKTNVRDMRALTNVSDRVPVQGAGRRRRILSPERETWMPGPDLNNQDRPEIGRSRGFEGDG